MAAGSQQVTWKALKRRGLMRRCDRCLMPIRVGEIAEVSTNEFGRTLVVGRCCYGKERP